MGMMPSLLGQCGRRGGQHDLDVADLGLITARHRDCWRSACVYQRHDEMRQYQPQGGEEMKALTEMMLFAFGGRVLCMLVICHCLLLRRTAD